MKPEFGKLRIHKEGGKISNAGILLIVLIAAAVPLSLVLGPIFYTRYFELIPPEIRAIDTPRGVGVKGAKIKFEIEDQLSGISFIKVFLIQRGKKEVLYSERPKREKSHNFSIELPPAGNKIEEGSFTLLVQAKDASFWPNASESALVLLADLKNPKITQIYSSSRLKEGGVGLMAAEIDDRNLLHSDISIQNRNSPLFPATFLDRELNKEGLFAGLFTIKKDEKLKYLDLNAEDEVGNSANIKAQIDISKASFNNTERKINSKDLSSWVKDLGLHSEAYIEGALEAGDRPSFASKFDEALVRKWLGALAKVGVQNSIEAVQQILATTGRRERKWRGAFLRPRGSVLSNFGDKVNLKDSKGVIGTFDEAGMTYRVSGDAPVVFALNDGIVILSQQLGTYGKLVGIDHGFGVVSIYSNLENSLALPGALVRRGDRIGHAGRSGIYGEFLAHIEIWVGGEPADPRVWMGSAYGATIAEALNGLKKKLGIPIFSPMSSQN